MTVLEKFDAQQLINEQGKHLVIPEGITHIGYGAFDSAEIETLVLPSSLRTIGDWAFASCISLESITFNDGIQSIGGWAFYDCSISVLQFPDSIHTIGNYAFSWNPLEDLDLGNGLRAIGQGAFGRNGRLFDGSNNYLNNVRIPDTVEVIGEWSFYQTRITDVSMNESTEYTGSKYSTPFPQSAQIVLRPSFIDLQISEKYFDENLPIGSINMKESMQFIKDKHTCLIMSTTF